VKVFGQLPLNAGTSTAAVALNMPKVDGGITVGPGAGRVVGIVIGGWLIVMQPPDSNSKITRVLISIVYILLFIFHSFGDCYSIHLISRNVKISLKVTLKTLQFG
jgi:hypothetical protein